MREHTWRGRGGVLKALFRLAHRAEAARTPTELRGRPAPLLGGTPLCSALLWQPGRWPLRSSRKVSGSRSIKWENACPRFRATAICQKPDRGRGQKQQNKDRMGKSWREDP